MQVNNLGFLATILALAVPSIFLVLLYVQTVSREGGKKGIE